MPYLNEKVETNRELHLKQVYEHSELRNSRFKFSPKDVAEVLRSRILGQDAPLDAVENMLYTVKADFGESNRPLCVLFFRGPTGVGKTETVRVLAECIRGNANKFCRIDMNTLAQDHYAAALTGSPPGYVGSKDGHTLFQDEHIKGSFSEPGIVLFDEIEKASKPVTRALMNLFDTGVLRLTSGVKELDFSNTMVFITSNIGMREYYEQQAQPWWKRWSNLTRLSMRQILDKSLENHFDPEFINRLDAVVTYDDLPINRLSSVLELEIKKLNGRLVRRNAQLNLDAKAERFLCKEYDSRYGARDLIRRLKHELEPQLAHAMLMHPGQASFQASTMYEDSGAEAIVVNAV